MVDLIKDEETGNRWWPFAIFSLMVVSLMVVLFVNLDSGLRSPLEPTTGCVAIQDRGNYRDSINVVFLGTSYEDVTKFQEDSEKMIDSFLNTVPYSEYPERFNFFRVEEFGDYGCEYGDAIVCSPGKAQREAIKCPGHDYMIVLSDRSNVENFFSHLRSSAWQNLASLNAADDPLVFTHEFAHLYPDFADEYEFGGDINWDAPNCDGEELSCPKFSSVEGSECVIGCVNKDHARSIKIGIMRDYWSSKRYGEYNEWYIRNLILEDTKKSNAGKVEGSPKRSPQNVYLVSGKCFFGSCQIEEVRQSPGYLTENKLVDSELVVEYGDYKVNVPNEDRIIKEFRDSGEIVYSNEFEFSVAVPILDDEEIVLLDSGAVEDTYLISNLISGQFGGFGENIRVPEVSG